MTRRTQGALARVVQAQMHHPDVQRRWRMRWLKRAQIHLPLFRRLQTNPVDLHDWNHGILYQGLVAFSRRTGEDAPADLVATIGRENHWEIGKAPWRSFDHPDDFAIGAAYVALAPLRPEPAMLHPLRSRLRQVMASAGPTDPWWIDALAMAPPTWADLACHDRDRAPLQLAAARSLQVAKELQSPEQRLFFRDQRQKLQAEEAGRTPVFWGRGNGWAVAGLARVLARLPAENPRRDPLLRLYRDTVEALMARRTSDGQLPTDLARPEMGGETSATALLVFAVTHGINSGLLERQRWQAPILFSWEHLLTRVKASGELADVQPPGETPGPSHHLSLQPFAAGLVLMAGEEVLTLLVPPPRTRPKAC